MSLPKKAKSYTQKFRAEWQKETDFKAWLVPVDGDNSLARCRLCSKNFGAKRYNLQQHKDTAYHKKLENNLPSVVSTLRTLHEPIHQRNRKRQDSKAKSS